MQRGEHLVRARSGARLTGRLSVPLAQSGVMLVGGLIIVVFYSRDYFAGVFVLALPFALVTAGMAVQIGFSRQIAFSQAVFMGVGAYGVAVLNAKAHIASAPAALIVTVAGGILAFAVGSVVCRARGLALAVATIMFTLIGAGYVGGATYLGGVVGMPLTGNLWPWGTGNDLAVGDGVIVVVVVAGAVFFASRLLTSPVGLELFMLGADEATAAAMGVATPRRKLELFVAGSTMATLGGALYAGSELFVPWTLVTIGAQFYLLLMLFVGGRRSVPGAVIGAVIIQYLAGISLFIARHLVLIEGGVITIILLIEPEGLAGIATSTARTAVQRLRRGAAPTGQVFADGGPGLLPDVAPVPGSGSARLTPGVASDLGVGRMEQRPVEASGSDLLVVDDVVKAFGGLQVLDHINLSLPATGIFGLCGPNGAGKSVLLNIIAGSLPPSSGRVLLHGRDATNRSAHEHFDLGVSRTFQTVHLVPGRTVLENVAVSTLTSKRGGLVSGVFDAGMPAALEKAEAALEFLGIEELRDRPATSLTLEGQRMVELARAIAPQPRLLLLDEPASGMSASQRSTLQSTLRSVSTITAILLVEHDLRLVADVAERIYVLLAGRLVFKGDGEAFYASELVQSVLIGRSERLGRRRGRRSRPAPSGA